MFAAIGVTFFVLPILLLLQAFGTQFTSGMIEDWTKTDSEASTTNKSRLLDEEKNEVEADPLPVVKYWIFISLINLILFTFTMLTPLLRDLYRQSKDPSKVKIKNKPLGGYSDADPKRHLQMRESIYSLAFAANLKNSFLDKQGVPEECRPSSMQRAEVNLTAYFCAFCQIFTSLLLFQDFIKQNNESEEEEKENDEGSA